MDKAKSPVRAFKPAIDSDDMYDDLDMDDLEACTAPVSPSTLADEVTAPMSPGGIAIAQVQSSNHAPPAPVPGPAGRKPLSNIFADSPMLPPKLGAGKRKRVVVSSSPDKVAAEAAAVKPPSKRFQPADDSELVLLSAPRPKGRLIKAAEAIPGKVKKASKLKLAADGCPFFDLRAENSDDPDSATDPEDDYGGPET